MSVKLYSETDIQNIADAIRSKTGESGMMLVSEMADKISNISGGISTLAQNQSITLTGDGSDVLITTADLTGKGYVLLQLIISSAGHGYDQYRFSVGMISYTFQKNGVPQSSNYTHNIFVPISSLGTESLYLAVTPYSGSSSRTVTISYIVAV